MGRRKEAFVWVVFSERLVGSHTPFRAALSIQFLVGSTFAPFFVGLLVFVSRVTLSRSRYALPPEPTCISLSRSQAGFVHARVSRAVIFASTSISWLAEQTREAVIPPEFAPVACGLFHAAILFLFPSVVRVRAARRAHSFDIVPSIVPCVSTGMYARRVPSASSVPSPTMLFISVFGQY
ncbi:hypothetical protein C8R45DRAFT_1027300 [Mycena sanguinolenta]|nr:hypothetical protein C8R45DRAFT_1027286 [Mycena sanguinolenta]KAJ6462094.1 hypothetical protein C8R45DRAFT_1027300 [Mycena sanguinolenta]